MNAGPAARRSTTIAAVVAGLLAAAPPGVAAASPFDVYVVAIGSSNYAKPVEGDHGLLQIYGANGSARAVATRLLAGGARRAILVTTPVGALMSGDDVHRAIDAVAARIRDDAPRHGLLVFYFAGHGISEGVGWTHFAVPGTFTFRGSLPAQGIEEIAGATIPTADIVARLDAIGVRYLALIDTCYEGTPAEFASPVLTGPAIANLRSVAGVLRFINEFHQASPILFSTRPGTLVDTVPNPADGGPIKVAPLARRAMIALDGAGRSGGPVTLRAFVDLMTALDLDPLTAPAVTNATPAPDWADALAYFPATPGVLEETAGTATTATVCCTPAAMPAAVPPDTASGAVDFAQVPGEYVSGGGGLAYRGPVTVAQDAAGAITFGFHKDGEDWELAFAAPGGERLKKGRYASLARYGFAANKQPSLAVTGGGHACNEVKGAFTVDKVDYATGGDRITAFAVTFEQVCDDVRATLKGVLRMTGR